MCRLSGLEQAIRNALERAERSDPDIRARIYQSARNALDVGLRKQEIADTSVIERQRQRLEATIAEIEGEELERLRSIARFERVALEREPEPENEPEKEADMVAEPERPADFSAGAHHGRRLEPTFGSSPKPATEPLDAEFEDESAAVEPARRLDASQNSQNARTTARVEPTVEARPDARASTVSRRSEPAADDSYLAGLSATRDARPSTSAARAEAPERNDEAEAMAPTPRRRGRLGSLVVSAFVYLFLFAIIGGGVWWVYDTGMIDAALKGDGEFQLVPDALRSERTDPSREDARLDTLRGFSGDWINIYKPGAATDAARPRAKAVIDEDRDSDGLATVITSNAPDQDGDVLIEVPAALLQALAGKTSTIAVTVKSNTEKPAHIYVQCEFKTLGDCGRHRYTVTNERADELIQVKFDGKMSPSSAGYIVINSDLTGEGSSIRLYGIRVLPGN